MSKKKMQTKRRGISNKFIEPLSSLTPQPNPQCCKNLSPERRIHVAHKRCKNFAYSIQKTSKGISLMIKVIEKDL